jgi:hypothetical protein
MTIQKVLDFFQSSPRAGRSSRLPPNTAFEIRQDSIPQLLDRNTSKEQSNIDQTETKHMT